MDKLGFGEILVLALCFFFVFGGAKLPKLAKKLGELEEENEKLNDSNSFTEENKKDS